MLRRTLSGSRRTSYPATRAVPLVGCVRVVIIRTVVVLPAPLGPSRPSTVAGGTAKLTPSTAGLSTAVPPNLLTRSTASIAGVMPPTVSARTDTGPLVLLRNGDSARGFEAREQGLPAGADVLAHHPLGAVAVLGDDQLEHAVVLAVGLQRAAGLAE